MKSRTLLMLVGILGASMSLSDRRSQAQPAAQAEDPGDPAEAQPPGEPGVPGPPAGASAKERDAWLGQHIAGLIAERGGLAGTRIGIQVADATTGRVIYQRDAEARYSVASCAKIITAAAALALLGPNFQPRTEILAEALDENGVVTGDLYFRGRGDPGLGLGAVDRMAQALARRGITAVQGRLVIDDSYFDDQVLPPHFDEQPDEDASFRAPVSALSPAFNAFSVFVRPALSGQGPAVVSIEPPGNYARIEQNDLLTQLTGRNRIRIKSAIDGRQVAISLAGQIRANIGMRRFRRRIPDPRVFAGALLTDALAERRIAIRRRRAATGPTPEQAIPLTSVVGEPVAVLVRGLGKHSNNFVAEMLLKIIGAETRQQPGPATWQDGLAAVRGFLADEVGLAPDTYRYGNGSGLFDATELSPAQLVKVLSAARKNPRYGPDLVASLAISGVDGTIRRRMIDTPAAGRIRAKTGTLAKVSALSGYALADRREPLAFSIIINDLPDRGRAGRTAKKEARALQDRIADALILYGR